MTDTRVEQPGGRPRHNGERPACGEAAVEIRALRSVDDLVGLAAVWDAMVFAMARPSPYLLSDWLIPWWREYRESTPEIRLALHCRRPVGAVPLTLERRLGLRVLRFPGGSEAVLGDLLLAADAPPAVARLLVEDLVARPVHDLADLHGLPGDSMLGRFGPDVGTLRLRRRLDAPVFAVTGSWEQVYRERIRSKHRTEHRRRRRRLGERGQVVSRIVRAPEEMDTVLAQASRVHRLRWAGRPDGSDFGTDRGLRFRSAAFRALAQRDIARVATLQLDGHVVAFLSYLVLAGRLYVDRMAFDPDLSEYSPGMLVALDALAAGIDEGAERVEFLGGAEPYKLEFADGPDPLYQARGFAPTARGRIAARSLEAATDARLRAKSSLRLRRFWYETLAPARRALTRSPSA